MSCNPLDPAGCVKEAITSGLDGMAETFKDGANWAMKNLTTAWLHAPSPDVSSSSSVTQWINQHLIYFVAASMLGSVLVACWRLATTGKWSHARDLAESLVRVLVVSGVAGFLVTLGIQIGDLFSEWILAQTKVDFASTVVFAAVQNSGIVLVLALVVILAQVIQLGIMLIRNAMIVILVGVLPLAASASNTDMGRQWFQKSIAWLIAFTLYKPVAALLYAATFKMASPDQDIATQLSGVFLMLMAIFALPALMRFLVPAAAAMSGGNAGAMAGAVVGAAVATGAVILTGGAGAAAGGGFGGMSTAGATGASGAVPTGSAGGAGGAGSVGGSGSTTTGTPGSGGATSEGGAEGSSGRSEPSGGAGSSGATLGNVADAASSGMNAARTADDSASGAVGEQS